MSELLEEMTEEQLEAALEKKRKATQKKREAERKAYEKDRDDTINKLVIIGIDLNTRLKTYKDMCHEVMESQHAKLSEYGGIRGNSRGGFSITDTTGEHRVTRRRDTEPSWDERGQKAIELIKAFLHDTVKKRDTDLFEILMSFLEKNKTGDLEYGRVFSLLSHESKFNDERWVKGLELLKESFSHHLKGYGYEIKHKDENGKWQTLPLNFSSM